MQSRITRILGSTLAALTLVALAPASSSASATYSFYRITTNASVNTASQYTVTVYGAGETSGLANPTIGTNQALFVFNNTAAYDGVITDVYFQDGTLLNMATGPGGAAGIYTTAGVAFSQGANPGDLPGGNSLGGTTLGSGALNVDFKVLTTFVASADANNPAPDNGLNSSGDKLGILFNLIGSNTYANVITALNLAYATPATYWNADGTDNNGAAPNSGLRVGIHVQSIGSTSDSFVNGGQVAVPEPGTIALAITGLSTLGFRGLRRRNRKASV